MHVEKDHLLAIDFHSFNMESVVAIVKPFIVKVWDDLAERFTARPPIFQGTQFMWVITFSESALQGAYLEVCDSHSCLQEKHGV